MQKERPSCLGERHGDVTSNGSLWSAHTVYTHLCQQLPASSFTPADRHVIFTPAERQVVFTPAESHTHYLSLFTLSLVLTGALQHNVSLGDCCNQYAMPLNSTSLVVDWA